MTARLAIVRQRYNAAGGAERFTARVLEVLGRQQRLSVTLLTRQWQETAAAQVLACRPFYIGRLWRDWSFARCVCNQVAEHAFDLVQSHERIACCDIYRAGDGVHRAWLAQRSRILSRLSRLATRVNLYHRYTLNAEKRLFQQPGLKAVICNSHLVKQEIIRYFQTPAEKIHVIYNGIDTAAYHPDLKTEYRAPVRASLGVPADHLLFCFVGSGFERKGLTATLQALARLPAQAQLAVIGKDKNTEKFVRAAQTLGIAQRVHFLGPQADVKPYYAAADALVLPTLYDPFPNVVLEAMAVGLPVITSHSCGAVDVITHGSNGFLSDALDIPALAQNMDALFSHERRQQMSVEARITAAPYTVEKTTEKFLALYATLMPTVQSP